MIFIYITDTQKSLLNINIFSTFISNIFSLYVIFENIFKNTIDNTFLKSY